MKMIRVNYFNDATGKTIYFFNISEISKFSFAYSGDEDYLYLSFDNSPLEGVCENFNIIEFEIFLLDDDHKIFEITVINHSLYIHEKKIKE